MAEKKHNQLDGVALGMGCGAAILAGTLQLIIIAALVTSGEYIITRNVNSIPIGTQLFGLVSGQAVHFLVGYVTANYASHSKMSHAVIIAGVSLLLGFWGIIINPMGQTVMNFFSFLLLIPVTMLGAKLAISRSNSVSLSPQESSEAKR